MAFKLSLKTHVCIQFLGCKRDLIQRFILHRKYSSNFLAFYLCLHVMSFMFLFDLSIFSLTLIHPPLCSDLCKGSPLMPKSWLPVHQSQIEIQSSEEKKERVALFLPVKGETQQASALRTVPHFLRNKERFYILSKSCFFSLFFCKISKWPQLASGNSVTGVGLFRSYKAVTSFLKGRMLQGCVCVGGGRMPGAEYNS